MLRIGPNERPQLALCGRKNNNPALLTQHNIPYVIIERVRITRPTHLIPLLPPIQLANNQIDNLIGDDNALDNLFALEMGLEFVETSMRSIMDLLEHIYKA